MFKNIVREVRVFAVEWEGGGGSQPTHIRICNGHRGRPSPCCRFRTIGGTEDDAYFGEGITDDIITGLSRSRSLYVIARNSMLRYRDRVKDLRQIATELERALRARR